MSIGEPLKLFTIATFCFLVLMKPIWAVPQFKEPTGFDKDVEYNVYYSPSKREVDMVGPVKITGARTIEGKKFLVAEGSSALNKKETYIEFDAVRAVVPSGEAAPSRHFCAET